MRSLRANAEVRAYRRDPKGAGHMRNLRELDSDIEIVNDPLESDDLSNQPDSSDQD